MNYLMKGKYSNINIDNILKMCSYWGRDKSGTTLYLSEIQMHQINYNILFIVKPSAFLYVAWFNNSGVSVENEKKMDQL